MLEHWYKVFPAGQIKVLCTESLSVTASGVGAAASEMSAVARFIGLSTPFDFTATLAKGKFNAANNKGYSKVTSWADVDTAAQPEMPLALHHTIQHFYEPYNERLFELAGIRCEWP